MTWASAALRRAGGARRSPVATAPAALPKPPPSATESTAAAPAREPRLRDWLGVIAMVVGLFMAIMDVQIVTSSLTQIQGGLSASADEISWVQTAYLIADVVMVPLSGTLSRLLRSASPRQAPSAPPPPTSAR
jgi:DHA2 family multidrug resistance protein